MGSTWRKNRSAARGQSAIAAACRPAAGARSGEGVSMIALKDIENARRLLAGVVVRTPMLPAPKLSALTGATVYVKYENFQVTNSFKDRGALVKLSSLGAAERARGVVGMSAGNHAQAVAYHAGRLSIPATIVMPVGTPFVKVAATRALGAAVELYGDSVGEAQARVDELVAERGLIEVHPYADPHIIAGQGTIALECWRRFRISTCSSSRSAGADSSPAPRSRPRRSIPPSAWWAWKPRSIPRCATPCAARAAWRAGRRSPKGSPSRTWPDRPSRSCGSSSPISCWSTSRISSGR